MNLWAALRCIPSRLYALEGMLHRVLQKEDRIMATLADIVAADAQVKTELESIAAGIVTLQASNADLAKQLADAIAANDPAALQAALDAANALVTQGQAVVDSLPKPVVP